MAGQIIKRGESRWLVRVALGRDSMGRRKYHNKTVRGTKKEAEQYRTRILRELDVGTFVQASPIQLASYLSDWLTKSAALKVSSRTFADYSSLATRHISPQLGHLQLAKITPIAIQSAYADLLARGLAPRTVRYVHSVLHNALEQAVRWQLLARNPAKLVSLPRNERREMRALSTEEATRFIGAVRGTRFEALWLLLLTSGLRPGEALGLKWSDIRDDRVHVQRALVTHDGGWELREPKTPRARRVVSLPVSAVEALHAHRARQAEARLRCGAEWNDLDLVFSNRRGEPLEWRVIARRHFKSLCAKALLVGLRPYDLRHSCATLLLGAGENIKVVSERLGHASAALTLDVYSHVLPDMQQGAADRIEALLFDSGPSTERQFA